MTFVGRILVFVILAFSLFFLAITAVVFNTSVNWKEETRKKTELVNKLQKDINDAKAANDELQKQLATAKDLHQKDAAQAQAKGKSYEASIATLQQEITAARTELETTQQNAKVALDQAKQRREETEQLRATLDKVQNQADEYAIQETELKTQINTLTRYLDTAKRNNAALRDRVEKYVNYIQEKGLHPTESQLGQGTAAAPENLQGEVKRVSAYRDSKLVELTVGSDDGIAVGQKLYIYRYNNNASEYVGQVEIISVDSDQSVGRLLGRTYLGREIKEGDIASPTIGTRSS